MDRITETLVKEFVSTHGLATKSAAEQFEYFANYSILFPHLNDEISLDDVCVGDAGNIGIDGAAIIVNGSLVTTVDEITHLLDANKYLDVDFTFVQSKMSDTFDLGEILKFLTAVKSFFTGTPQLAFAETTKELHTLKEHLYTNAQHMKNRNPSLSLYFVTTGRWTDDTTLRSTINESRDALSNTQLFSGIEFFPVDADRLRKSYRETQGKSSASFTFTSRVTLPSLGDGVSEAHFGVIDGAEFLKMIEDNNGNIKKTLFYDNVRDFQNLNDVNREIRATLEREADQKLFPLLNNGVTIVARKVRPTGNIFQIEDFQIVNGCQTSHVLHLEKSKLRNGLLIPIKLIATADDEIVNQIIKGTNFQTEVKSEQLYALSDFQKQLEEYYGTFSGDARLYYERRSMQYMANLNVEKIRIVSIQQQIRAFTSMFLEEPHRGHYPKAVAPNVGGSIFGRCHIPAPYHLSAYALFKLEGFFRNGGLPKKYKPARYHLLLGLRVILESPPLPEPGSRKMRKYCEHILVHFKNDETLLDAFRNACKLVDEVCGHAAPERSVTKTQPFTEKFIAVLKRYKQTL